jgi:hypothetical protein
MALLLWKVAEKCKASRDHLAWNSNTQEAGARGLEVKAQLGLQRKNLSQETKYNRDHSERTKSLCYR